MEKNLAKHSVKENSESVSPLFSFFSKIVMIVYVMPFVCVCKTATFIIPVKVIFFCIAIVIVIMENKNNTTVNYKNKNCKL